MATRGCFVMVLMLIVAQAQWASGAHETFISRLQIYDIWKIRSEYTNTEQFRCLLSDGEELQHAIFPAELTEKVNNSSIKKGTVILMSKYELYAHIHHPVKRMIRILDLRIVETDFTLIGEGLEYILMFGGKDGENKWMEQDWAEELWEWMDPDEQEWMDPDELEWEEGPEG